MRENFFLLIKKPMED